MPGPGIFSRAEAHTFWRNHNRKDSWPMTKQNHLFRRLDALLTAGLLLAMLLTPLAGFGRRCAQVRGEVLRLHILANSDSAADQALKLLVRDAVLRETGDLFSSAATLEEALARGLTPCAKCAGG